MRFIFFAILFSLATGFTRAAELQDTGPVKRWIARQEDFHAVTADFTQTRSLRALRSPLASQGRLWFKAPDAFRWEVGNPAKTIVLRKSGIIYVIQPGKKRVERSPVDATGKNGGAQALGMMNFPMAKDFADFQRQFEILSVSTEGAHCHLEVLPRDPRAQKMLTALKIDFNTANGHLLAFEMVTRDGSSLRNEFSNVQVNPKLERAVFDFDFTGFEVVDAKP